MLASHVRLLLFVVLLVAQAVIAAERSDVPEAADVLQPVMVDLTDREPPSDEEWEALHEEERSGFLGGLGDFRSKAITFCDTRYFTGNAAEGTLASYGKAGGDNRFDRFGHITGVEFAVDENSWKQHQVINAAALMKIAGSRFFEFAGVGFDVAVKSRQQIEVTFVGTMVPKDEAVRRLNVDVEALEYLAAVWKKYSKYEGKSLKLGTAPPAPKVVLANVVMLNGNFSKALDVSVDGKLYSRIVGAEVELKVEKQDGETLTLLSPVVRCYRTYSIDFKTDDGKLVLKSIRGSDGTTHQVPQVFDLTPDL